MLFKELILENFGPYTGRHVIDLRPEVNEDLTPSEGEGDESRPIILFGGMNGAGKTTLIDAIRLALYGSRAQCSTRGKLGYSEFLTQAVNKWATNVDTTRIELTFEHIYEEKWTELKVVRTWTRNPKDGKDNLGIINGDWPDTGLTNIWDEYIENLLPIGISNLFLFDGEQVKELAEQDTPPQVVVEAIQSLLGLELAEKLAKDLDILLLRKKKALASKYDLQNIEEIEAKLNELNEKKNQAKQELADCQAKLQEAQENYDYAANNFRREGGKIAEQRSQLKHQQDELEAAKEKEIKALLDIAAGCLPLGLILPLLNQAAHQGEKELKYLNANIALGVMQQRDERLLSYLNELDLSSNQLEDIKLFLSSENQTLQQQAENVSIVLQASKAEIKQLESVLQYHLPLQLKLTEEQLNKIQELEIKIQAIEKQLVSAASPEEYDKLDKAVKKAEKDLIECKTAYVMATQKCNEIERLITKSKKDLNTYSEQAIARQNDEHIVTSIGKVQNTLEIFREKLTLKKLTKLEVEITKCFRYLLHKSDLVQRITINTNDYSLALYDSSGEPVEKHRLSAGEKQLLAIAFLWGLARVSKRNLPIAIDTPLGRLDSSHRNNLVERYFPTASHQVILFSTDTEIGKTEVELLRAQNSIAKEYVLEYDSKERKTNIKPGYFW